MIPQAAPLGRKRALQAMQAAPSPPAPTDDATTPTAAHDLRLRALLGAAAWSRLPPAVRRRFSTRLTAGAAITYAGAIAECHRSLFSRLFAQLARVVGAPFPLSDAVAVPVVVTVTEDEASGGQLWTRMYGRRRGFPQVIHSSMRFSGPTGLEEHLRCGLGIALTVRADDAALHFASDHYFVALGAVRMRLPHWLGPGALTISHIDRPGGAFDFVLAMRHPLLGDVMHQTIQFHERCARADREALHD